MITQNLNNRQGFDEISFSITISPSFKLLSIIINQFFEYLELDNKYFLLMRIQFSNGSFKTLHKGIVISKDSKDRYIEYTKNLLSLRSNDYQPEHYSKIIFNFFLIDKDKEQYYIDKWSELLNSPKPIKLEKFGNYLLPLNTNYSS